MLGFMPFHEGEAQRFRQVHGDSLALLHLRSWYELCEIEVRRHSEVVMNGRKMDALLSHMMEVDYLIPRDMYEQHFVHIGTQQSSAHMTPFLEAEKQEGTGLYLIDIEQTNSRFFTVANFLSRF